MITYSTSRPSRPTRSSPALIAIAPSPAAGCEARPPFSFPNGVRVAAADVGRARDVDRERDFGLDGECARARAGEVADLLQYRRHRDHVAGASPALGDPARRLEGDVAADAVVEGARGDALAAQRER